jgi:hypothetical protein
VNSSANQVPRLVILGSLLQSAFVALQYGANIDALVLSLSCLTLVSLLLWWYRVGGQRSPLLMGITVAYGGLGMLAGALMDRPGVEPLAGAMHHDHTSGIHLRDNGLLSWTYGSMMIFCVVSCWVLCPLRGSVSRKLLIHSFCALGMIAGMELAVGLRGDKSIPLFDDDGNAYIVMLLGMALGASLTEFLLLFITRSFTHEDQTTTVSN